MQAQAQLPVVARTGRSDRPLPAFPQLRNLPSPIRSRLPDIFPEEIVACIIEARSPARHEVEAVAAKIWNDLQPARGAIKWRELVHGCERHRQMIAAATAALCGHPDREGSEGNKPP